MWVENFQRIAAKRKTCLAITYFFLFYFGVMLFPINEVKYLPLLLGIPLGYFYVGLLFAGLYDGKPLLVFLTTFLLNVIGLSARVSLEWGEHTLMSDLTLLNISLYVMSIPAYVVVMYIILERVKRRAYEEVVRPY